MDCAHWQKRRESNSICNLFPERSLQGSICGVEKSSIPVSGLLKPLLYESTEGVNEIVAQMEGYSESLRREMAEKIYPST